MCNLAAVNSAPVNTVVYPTVDDSGQVTYETRYYIGVGAVNSAPVNHLPINGSLYTEELVEVPGGTVTSYYHLTGAVNSFAVNAVPINGARVSVVETSGGSTTAPYRVIGTVNGFAVNSAPVNGSYDVAGSGEGEPTPSHYTDDVETVSLAISSTESFLAWLDDVESATVVTDSTSRFISDDVSDSADTRAGDFTEHRELTQDVLSVALITEPLQATSNTSSDVESNSFAVSTYSAAWLDDTTDMTAATVEVSGSAGTSYTAESSALAVQAYEGSAGRSDDLEVWVSSLSQIMREGTYNFEDLEDEVAAVATLDATRRLYETLDDAAAALSETQAAAALRDTVTSSSRVVVVYSEAFAKLVRDTVESLAFAAQAVEQHVAAFTAGESVALAYGTPGLVASEEAWVFNTRTLAMSRYAKLGASQLATLDGELTAVTPMGIARAGGGTARATTTYGILDFDSPSLKSLRHMYITAASRTPLSVITRAGQGSALKQVEYKPPMAEHEVPVTYRLDFARGQKSTYWGFELVSEADSNAIVLQQRVVPLIDSRRV